MSRAILGLSLAAALCACASAPPPVEGQMAPAPQPRATPGGWAVSIVGTPFAVAFKSVVCVASLAIAAPIAGFLALDPDPYDDGLEALGDGVASNCGPPWAISPYDAS
jgi:hypothetical protein